MTPSQWRQPIEWRLACPHRGLMCPLHPLHVALHTVRCKWPAIWHYPMDIYDASETRHDLAVSPFGRATAQSSGEICSGNNAEGHRWAFFGRTSHSPLTAINVLVIAMWLWLARIKRGKNYLNRSTGA